MREYAAIVVLDLNLTAWLLARAIGALPHLGAEDDSIEPLLVICPEYLHLGAKSLLEMTKRLGTWSGRQQDRGTGHIMLPRALYGHALMLIRRS